MIHLHGMMVPVDDGWYHLLRPFAFVEGHVSILSGCEKLILFFSESLECDEAESKLSHEDLFNDLKV